MTHFPCQRILASDPFQLPEDVAHYTTSLRKGGFE
jgi:hypothetical protein